MVFSTHFAQAKHIKLVDITRSDKSSKASMKLVSNDVGDARYLEMDFGSSKPDIIRPWQLAESGKVLLKQKGMNVLIIKSRNFSIYSGGTITLRYLKEYNILSSNKYAHYNIELERDGDNWIVTRNGKRFTKMYVNVYTWGIKSINFFN